MRLTIYAKIHLVITDYHLPGISGIDLIKEVFKFNNEISFILLTADYSISVAVEAMKAGADDFLPKDDKLPNELIPKVKQVFKKHLVKKEKNRIAKQLVASENKFRAMMEAMRDPVYIGDENYNISYANPAMLARIGAIDNNAKCYKVVHNLDSPCGWCKIKDRTDDTKVAVEIQSPLDSKYFQTLQVPVQLLADHKTKMSIYRDITHEKEAEQKLVEQNRFLDEILNNVKEGVCIIKPNEEIEFANNATAGIFELPYEELKGRSLLDFVGTKTSEYIIQGTELRRKGITSQYEIEIQTINGKKKHLLLSVTPRYDGLVFIGSFTVILDITARKNTENVIRELNNELENRVAERTKELENAKVKLEELLKNEIELNQFKSQIVTIVSHEFRTPLSIISSSTDLLEMLTEVYNNDRLNKYFDRIKMATEQLTSLLSDVLTIERLDAEVLTEKPTDIRQLINEIIEQVLTAHNSSHSVKCLIPYKYDNVLIDHSIFSSILMNLLTNAIKFSPHTSVVTVKFSIVKNIAYLSVADHGIGIPKSEQERIFEMFTRASNSENTQGTGLGLSIIKRYADMLGGKVVLNSTEGKGTIISLEIPIKFE